MVSKAETYPWSSDRARVGLENSGLLDASPCTLSIEDYRAFVEQGIEPEEYLFIRERLQRNGLTGGGAFVDEVERRTGLRFEARGPGRPVGNNK